MSFGDFTRKSGKHIAKGATKKASKANKKIGKGIVKFLKWKVKTPN